MNVEDVEAYCEQYVKECFAEYNRKAATYEPGQIEAAYKGQGAKEILKFIRRGRDH